MSNSKIDFHAIGLAACFTLVLSAWVVILSPPTAAQKHSPVTAKNSIKLEGKTEIQSPGSAKDLSLRRLAFPNKFSLGKLYTYTPADKSSLPLASIPVSKSAGHYIGEARGILTVPLPKNALIYLFPSYEMLSHPEALLSVAPNTLDCVAFGNSLSMEPVDKVLGPLAHLTGLRSLELENGELTDAGLAQLKTLINLEFMSLCGNSLTGTTIKDLSHMTRLKHLDLTQNQLGHSAYAGLALLADLQWLHLKHCGVNDAAIVELSKLKNLKDLSIGAAVLSTRSLLLLKGMKNLHFLDMTGAPLSVKDVLLLKGSAVTYLSLSGSRFSPAEITSLRAGLPGVHLSISQYSAPLDSETNKMFAPLH